MAGVTEGEGRVFSIGMGQPTMQLPGQLPVQLPAQLPAQLPIQPLEEPRVFLRRWFVLAAFCLVSMMNAFQWVQYSSISDSVMIYFEVSPQAVDWTSMIYMVMYIPFILPASWMLDKQGLRRTLLLAAVLNCLAAWIKVAGVRPDLFAVIFAGQTLAAITQAFILSVPARLAAVWFGAGQVSTACAIGVFGNQVGTAVGFAVPHLMVRNGSSLTQDERGDAMRNMAYGVAAACTLGAVLVAAVFQDAPPVPPSRAQQQAVQQAALDAQDADREAGVLRPVRQILAVPGFMLLLVAYGVSVGVFYALSTVLNNLVLSVFPASEDAGNIGLLLVLSGLLGSLLCGLLLDATAKYKEVTLAVYFLSLVGMVAFAVAFVVSTMWAVYVAAAFLGFFLTGYLPVGFEFASELTYPHPEGTASGLLNVAAQVFGVVLTELCGWLLGRGSGGPVAAHLAVNALLCTALVLGAAITALIPNNLRRQAAQQLQQAEKSPAP